MRQASLRTAAVAAAQPDVNGDGEVTAADAEIAGDHPLAAQLCEDDDNDAL